MIKIQKKIILGSNSPRRQEILAGIGLDFEVKKAEIEEVYPLDLDVKKVALYLSRLKVEYFAKLYEDSIIICADTVVIINNEILGKPIDEADAVRMLNLISGTDHLVITGVSIYFNGEYISFEDRSEVFFRKIEEKEIKRYVSSGKCFDKAGAYGVQDSLGMIGIEKIIGSYYNVMGLPIHLVYEKLKLIEKKLLSL